MKKTGYGLSAFSVRVSLILLALVLVLFLGMPSSSGQKPPKSEESDTFGVGGKKTTSESKDANGDTTTEENWYDPKGKLRKKKTTTKKPGGEGTDIEELYDCNGKIEGRTKVDFDAQNKTTSYQKEDYQDGILSEGFIWEMDENGDVKSNKEYNPATERYEERPVKKADKSPFPPMPWPDFPGTCPTSSPGYDADIAIYDGIVRVDFKTAFGGIQVFLPDDLAAGDTCTGSIRLEPSGKTAAERSDNLSKIRELELEFGRERLKTADSLFTLELPRVLNSSDRFLRCRHRGRIVLEVGIPLYAERPRILDEFVLPTGGQQGRLIEINGPCNGTPGKNDYVKIGETALPLLAESPRKMIFRNTTDQLGPTKLSCSENGKVAECPFRNIGINLSANKLNLLKGETTQLRVAVLGLARLDQEVPLHLENNSPSVIDMAGGVRQYKTIQAGDVQADGTYVMDRTLTGIVAGSFRITGTVRWRHLCKDGKPLSDTDNALDVGDRARGAFAKDVNGPPNKDGQPQKYRTCGGQCKSPVTDPSGTFCSQEKSCSDNVGCQCHMYDSFGKEDISEWKHVWKPGDSKRTENPNFRCLCVKPK